MGLLATLIKGKWVDLMGFGLLDLDLLTIIITYLFLSYGHSATAAFAFGQGLLIDLLSGGLHGLFPFLYLSIFWGIHLGSQFFDLQEKSGLMLILSLVVLLKKALFFVVLTIFSLEISLPKSFLWTSGASAIGTGLMGPVVFYLFNRLRSASIENGS